MSDQSENTPEKPVPLKKIGRIAMLCAIALALGLAGAAIYAHIAVPANLKPKGEESRSMSQKTEAAGPAKINQEAPDFELASESGKTVRLSDFRGNKAVVVYFYPKD